MSNPVQTYSGRVTTSSITLTFTTPPAVGNTLILAAYFSLGSGSSLSGVTVTDTGGNTWTNDLNQNASSFSGNSYVYVSHASVVSNAGSPFSISP